MATTARKLRNAEKRIARAQEALDKTKAGLHAVEEVALAREKTRRRPLVLALASMVMVGIVWMLLRDSSRH